MSNRVFVYWNLHKKVWSLRDVKTRRVIEHRQALCLSDCEFKVSEAGRQRVLREQRKNVHAGVVGDLCEPPKERSTVVRYNPYKQKTFTCCDVPVYRARYVVFHSNKTITAIF